MAKFVKFPGTAGSYASTDDVNLLDADTAHLQQSIGTWAGLSNATGLQLSQAVTPLFGDSVLQYASFANPGNVTVNTAVGLGGVPVVAGQTYSLSLGVQTTVTRNVLLQAAWYDGAGGFLSTTSLSSPSAIADSWTIPVGTAVAPASAEFVAIWFRIDNMANTEIAYVDAAIIRDGTVATFVPSLNIVGTLFEAFNATPTNPPIAFAADGTPLTVGVSWAGDLFTYSRHDGADASAPIVAEFNAEDITL